MEFMRKYYQQIPAYIYLFCMFSVFLFCFDDYYFNITETKYAFFKICTISLLICYALLCLLEIIVHLLNHDRGWFLPGIQSFFHSLNLADIALILFVLLHIASMFLNSYYQYEIWHGNVARYMGVEFYVLILIVYFLISRIITKIKPVLICFSISVSLVSLLAVCNFVGLDPFGFFKTLAANQKYIFLSTIGNVNFLSSLICLSFPITGFLYMGCRNRMERLFYFLTSILAFICMVLASSDSGYLGCGMFLFVSLVFVCKNYHRLFRWLFLVCSCFMFTKFTVTLLLMMPDGFHVLDTTSSYLFTGLFPWIVIGVCLLLLALMFLFRNALKETLPNLPLRIILIVVFLLIVLAFIAVVFYFTVVDPDYELGSLANYLRFDMAWGTSRRYIWDRSLYAYSEFTLAQKILGFGPGTVFFAVGTFLKDFTNNYDHTHSEYLQYLLTVGITGLMTYVVYIGFTLKYAFQKLYRSNVYLLALGLSFLTYLIQASINLNQIFTTPLFFLLAALLRQQVLHMDEVKVRYLKRCKDKWLERPLSTSPFIQESENSYMRESRQSYGREYSTYSYEDKNRY